LDSMEQRKEERRRLGGQAPERSVEQRRAALIRANEIRTRRAQLKIDVKARRADAALVLLEPEDWVETMKVWDLLLAVPKIGRVKTNTILVRQRISPSKTIGGLSQRQRNELVVALAPYGRRGRVASDEVA